MIIVLIYPDPWRSDSKMTRHEMPGFDPVKKATLTSWKG
jgi:hypothetical protein